MPEIQLNPIQFKTRLANLRRHIGSQTLMIILGKTSDVEIFGVNSALFLYLLNYEFPETIFFISQKRTIALTSPKKALLLEQLITENDIKILIRKKDGSNRKELHEKLKDWVGSDISIVDRPNLHGELCQEYLGLFNITDITPRIKEIFRIKTKEEIINTKKSSLCTNMLLKKGINEVLKYAKEGKRVSHGQWSHDIEEILDGNFDIDVDVDNIDLIFPPFIQSGNQTDFSEMNEMPSINFNVISVVIGTRYHGYCYKKGRTLLINPIEEEENEYTKLFNLRTYIFKMLSEGIGKKGSEIYKSITNYINDNRIENLNEEFCYTIGIIEKEEALDNEFTLEPGMIFCVDLQLNNKYNLTDILILGEEFSLDEKADFIYEIDVPKSRRGNAREKDKEVERNIMRTEHQRVLMEKLIEEQLAFYKSSEAPEKEKEVSEKYFSYKKENLIPRSPKISIDRKNMCVLVPISVYCVPVHIFHVKSVSKVEDTQECFLRMNFSGSDFKTAIIKGDRSTIGKAYAEINDLKKEFGNRDVKAIEPGELNEIKGRKTVLMDVHLRMDFRTGQRKSKASNLEIHENGFRYNNGSTSLDFLFTNVKHFLYQGGPKEPRTILHFHLNAPIIVGNKKTRNIQFYKDSSLSQIHDTKRMKEDDYMEEILEKEDMAKRIEIDNEFRKFISFVEECSSLRVDNIIEGKGFSGVVQKESSMIEFTSECLISLAETPFLVTTLSEIEIIAFERVVFGSKTFDITIVLKNKQVESILSVYQTELNKLKEYFDLKNVCFIEIAVNLQWNNLIKTIMQNPIGFYETGGWSELQADEEEEDSDITTSSEYTESEDDDETLDSDVSFVDESSLVEEDEPSDIIESEEYYDSEEEEEESDDRSKRRKK
ncbi:FACT complex subunit spt16 [Astathelohania contejeani]|uniref:FACT complex subunit n=1 Tax=Astathelohania contejeani TaxID=164912 RepID=A0ABQ7HZU7_9MICR|nr:FACT complex subunit spt16 [Thelohania contejeani]